MGHDVEIIVEGQVVDELYITGNFWTVRDRYGGIYDFHGHTGKTVARIIKNILSRAANLDGYEPGVPDQSNPNWGWGSNEGKPMPEKEFIEVFLYIMKGFLEKAEKYPTGRWYSDQVFKITPYVDDDTDNEENDSDGEERNLSQDLKERLYEEYIKPIVGNAAEKHFIIQHTSFQKNGDGEWVMTTTIDPSTGNGWPQYIESIENISFVENKADYKVEIWSYKNAFSTYTEFFPQHFPHEDDNGKLYAWNMIPDFKFRYFTGSVCLRGR
jgi:hypothetical protein